MIRIPPSARALLAGVALGIGAAACGNGSAAPSHTSAESHWPPSPRGTWGNKPTVVVPSVAPPKRLVEENLITGTGAVARTGDTVAVQYVGVSYSSKQQFDASWDRGQPLSFVLGVHQVIPGWDEGVAGMRVGGRRELIIPPALAYGASPPPGSGIAVNDALIFVVDLLQVQSSTQG